MWERLQPDSHMCEAILACSWDQPHTLLMNSALPATTPAEISEWPFKYLVALSHTTSMPTSAGLHLHAALSISPTWLTCKQELAQVQFNQTIQHSGAHCATISTANKKKCKHTQAKTECMRNVTMLSNSCSSCYLGICADPCAKCSVQAMHNKHTAF